MRIRTTYLPFLLCSLLLVSCADGPDTETATDTATEDEAVGTFIVLTGQTEDVSAWNARYESNAEARTAAGMSEVLTAEDIDRPGTVVTIQSVADHVTSLGFIESDESVLSGLDVAAVRMLELGPMPERPVAIVIVRGRADDVEAWRTSRDTGEDARESAGLYPAGTGLEIDVQSHVFEAWFATDLAAARTWVSDEQAYAALLPIGDTPVVRFVRPIN